MKRVYILILTCVIFLTGCGNKELNIDNVYNNLEKEYEGYIKVDSSTLEGVYGTDLSVFDSYLVVMNESNTTAKMYAVFEAKEDFDDALYEVKYFIDNYEKTWLNGYFPKEEKLVKDGILETMENYIIYVVNEDADKIVNMIKES